MLRNKWLIGLAVAGVAWGTVGCKPVTKGVALKAFKEAGPLVPEVDRSALLLAKTEETVYRPVAGDLLEFFMPQVLSTLNNGLKVPEAQQGTFVVRVRPSGKVPLPLIGKVKVAGVKLPKIERKVAKRYHGDYLKVEPSIIVRVKQYKTAAVTVVGAVGSPGIYELPHHQMSLIHALMKAGGIGGGSGSGDGGESEGIESRRARAIKIYREGKKKPKPVVLPVKGLGMADTFTDVQLKSGDKIQVVAMPRRQVSVLGYVNNPTSFAYPRSQKFTLFEAIAKAGGINRIAGPRYVTVYRQDEDEQIVAARFRLEGAGANLLPKEGVGLFLKPGDIVHVEGDAITDTRALLAKIVRVGIGITPDVGFFSNNND